MNHLTRTCHIFEGFLDDIYRKSFETGINLERVGCENDSAYCIDTKGNISEVGDFPLPLRFWGCLKKLRKIFDSSFHKIIQFLFLSLLSMLIVMM